MNCKRSILTPAGLALILAAVIMAASPSFAADVTFSWTAEARPVTMPDATNIMMWGFFDTAGTDWVPGPTLTLTEGDNLTIQLTNSTVPNAVSIVIPGQTTALAPVWFLDSQGRGRVSSLTAETAPLATTSYTWNNLKAGTYLYHSGTHPAVQVQMGLYGVLIVNAVAAVPDPPAPAQAYPGVPYDNEAVLLYSEIDPALHEAADPVNPLDLPTYGTPAYPSTINYKPEYFLINGQPYPNAVPILNHSISTNETVLIRMLNAGLKTHVPALEGGYMSVIAEDGNMSPYPKEQYSVLLPAGKTMDALWNPATAGTYPLYDRRLHLTSGGVTGGGMLVYLDVTGNNPPSITSLPGTAATEGVPYSYQVVATDPDSGDVLTYSLDVAPSLMTISATGLIEWTPGLADIGDHPMIVRVTDASGAFDIQSFTISVNPGAANHQPMITSAPVTEATEGVPYSYQVVATDPDSGDVLTYSLDVAPLGMTISATGLIEWTPGPVDIGDHPVTARVTDSGIPILFYTQAFTITVSAPVNIPPVAEDDYSSTPRNVPVFIDLIANDSDADGTINPNSVMITSAPQNPDGTYNTTRGGIVSVVTNGVIFTPKKNFRGTDVFTYTVNDNLGATSNDATVRVNVLR